MATYFFRPISPNFSEVWIVRVEANVAVLLNLITPNFHRCHDLNILVGGVQIVPRIFPLPGPFPALKRLEITIQYMFDDPAFILPDSFTLFDSDTSQNHTITSLHLRQFVDEIGWFAEITKSFNPSIITRLKIDCMNNWIDIIMFINICKRLETLSLAINDISFYDQDLNDFALYPRIKAPFLTTFELQSFHDAGVVLFYMDAPRLKDLSHTTMIPYLPARTFDKSMLARFPKLDSFRFVGEPQPHFDINRLFSFVSAHSKLFAFQIPMDMAEQFFKLLCGHHTYAPPFICIDLGVLEKSDRLSPIIGSVLRYLNMRESEDVQVWWMTTLPFVKSAPPEISQLEHKYPGRMLWVSGFPGESPFGDRGAEVWPQRAL